MNTLHKLFEQQFGSPPEKVEPLRTTLGASDRKIFRLSKAAQSAIGIVYEVREENVAFVHFSRYFRRHGLRVPEVYGEALDEGAYLEEDLGDTTLYEFLSRNRLGREIAPPGVE